MNSKIAVIGSLNADFVIRLERFPVPGETFIGRDLRVFPGGKGANQAYALGRLAATVTMIGQVGNDAQADWLKQNLAAAGVDVAHVTVDRDIASGVATIAIDAIGQNQIVIVPGANGTFTPAKLEAQTAVLDSCSWILLQLEIPLPTVEKAIAIGKQKGAKIILDPAPARELPDDLLAAVDYLTPNESELAILCRQPPGPMTPQQAAPLARLLLERGARRVLVKMGSQGALLVGPDRHSFWPAFKVEPVDSTAAGDAFNGAFAYALARGDSEDEAGRFACAAAAISVTRHGAQPSMPTLAEVESFLGQ